MMREEKMEAGAGAEPAAAGKKAGVIRLDAGGRKPAGTKRRVRLPGRRIVAILLLGSLAFCAWMLPAYAETGTEPFSVSMDGATPAASVDGATSAASADGRMSVVSADSSTSVVSADGSASAIDTDGTASSDGQAAMAAVRMSAPPVTMTVQYGYDDTAKGGRYLPLTVTIDNPGERTLSAVLEVKSEESDQTVCRYDYPVTVEGEAQLETRYYIPLGTNASRLFLILADENGNPVCEQTVSLRVSRDVPELFIGILSDEPERLSYLDGVGIRYSTLRTRTFVLEGDELPEDAIGLDLLDVLVVNDYKLRNLSEFQTAAIMDWVHSGGVLILGTGERVDDTLGRFAPELLDDSYGVPSLRHINLGETYPLENAGDGMLALTCVDIPLHGGNVVLSGSGVTLLTVASKEQGLIAVAGFDLGDIAEFCGQHSGYVDYMFTSLIGELRINQIAELVYSGNSSRFWSVQSLINTGDVEKMPNLTAYVAVVLVYLALLGPGLYLFLSHRGLQIYYRRGVVVLSIVFAGVIYIMGIPTRFSSTFYTYATIRDVTDDYVTDITYVNIRNPYNSPYTVRLNPSYSVLPITRSVNDTSSASSFSADSDCQTVISFGEDATTIQGQNITAFTPRYFELERKRENSDHVGIRGEVNYFEGSISGWLTNDFPFPLENTALILYGTVVEIGRMEPGETVDLSRFALLRFPLGNPDVVADRVSGESEYRMTDISDSEYLLALERSNMLKFYLDTYLNGYTADGRVIAFSLEKEETEFLETDAAETYGLTMLTESTAVNASQDSMVYRSALMKTPFVVSGSYDSVTNSMGGTEPLTLEYQLGEDIEVQSLTFETISEEFLEAESGIEAFDGNVYFYNYATGNYDRMDLTGKTLTVEQLSAYLSPANTLTVRYAYNGTGGFGRIQLPMPMVAGRGK